MLGVTFIAPCSTVSLYRIGACFASSGTARRPIPALRAIDGLIIVRCKVF